MARCRSGQQGADRQHGWSHGKNWRHGRPPGPETTAQRRRIAGVRQAETTRSSREPLIPSTADNIDI